jgi:phasin family protein
MSSKARKARIEAMESGKGLGQDTHEAIAPMSNTTAEMNSFIENTRKMTAPFTRATEVSARTFEKLARYQYEVAGDWLNLSIAQLHAATQSKDVPELMKKQAELTNHYFEKQTQRSQDFLKIATDAQSDITQLVDTAANEFARTTRAA